MRDRKRLAIFGLAGGGLLLAVPLVLPGFTYLLDASHLVLKLMLQRSLALNQLWNLVFRDRLVETEAALNFVRNVLHLLTGASVKVQTLVDALGPLKLLILIIGVASDLEILDVVTFLLRGLR